MISYLLNYLPFWITGRLSLRAHRDIRSWINHNNTLKSHQFSFPRKILFWGSDHPVLFTLLVTLVTVGISYVTVTQSWIAYPNVLTLSTRDDFEIESFVGVIWTVQATLIALVYPIVVSFIALMLQRKANSSVSLRIYILDSAVVPAGASSVGLLLLLTIQYFVSPYISKSLSSVSLAFLLLTNGGWIFLNVLLTGFFLSRTVRFVQEDEQLTTLTRIALVIVLRDEILNSIKKHIFVSAPEDDWKLSENQDINRSQPRIYAFAIKKGDANVRLALKGHYVLYDVHLNLLRLVAVLWMRRAKQSNFTNQKKGHPVLMFTPALGQTYNGNVTLCRISAGPQLKFYERWLVRFAFVFKPLRSGFLSLSTHKILDEMSVQVSTSAEQRRFSHAEEHLKEMIKLHSTLLMAGSVNTNNHRDNVLSLGVSPYKLINDSFDLAWLRPYRDLCQVAVNLLEEDSRLFCQLASTPTMVVSALPPRPEGLLINSQLIATNLMYHLANWWTKKADASLANMQTGFSGTLPDPLNRVYEQAVTSFIGRWGEFSVDHYDTSEINDSLNWEIYCSQLITYVNHIENSAKLFLDAVSRGDEVGSVWLLENFLKWWGNHEYSLPCQNIEYDFRVRDVTIDLTNKSWEEAVEILWDGGEDVTIEFSKMALNLALRRYWETMRLFLILLLIQKAEENPETNSREIRMAVTLIKAQAQRPGGNVSVYPLETTDDALSRFLGVIFGNHLASNRINQFAEKLSWDTRNPEVIGWPYSWSGTPSEMEAMKRPLGILLAALASQRRIKIQESQKLLECWWRDIDKLERVQRYISLLHEELLDLRTTPTNPGCPLNSLITMLGKSQRPRRGCIATGLALKKALKVARHQRRTTLNARTIDDVLIEKLRLQIGANVFDSSLLPAPFEELEFIPDLVAPALIRIFSDERKYYLIESNQSSREELAKNIGDHIRNNFFTASLHQRLNEQGTKPVNKAQLRHSYNSDRDGMREYVSSIASSCSTLLSQGKKPVILVGHSATRTLLNPQRWGTNPWQCPPPEGITIEHPKYIYTNSVAMINGIPVYQHLTPNQDCFVVDAKSFKTIAICGDRIKTALKLEHSPDGEDKLKFTVKIHGRFS